MNYKELCNDVIEIARRTGKFFLSEINNVQSADIQHKGLHDFVSYVDVAAEKQIVEFLKERLPEAGFIAEEGTSLIRGKRFNWIIDPLDGTTNFLHRIPLYSVSIALIEDDELVIGVVYEPNLDECFSAYKDGPAMLNGKQIQVSKITELDNALLATGFPYTDYGKLEGYMELFTYFARHTSGLRRLGSAAVDLAYTACGRYDGFYEYGLKPWDVAAGAFIVKQAGGTVSDFSGENNFVFGAELLSSNTILHEPLLDAVKSHFRY